MSKHARLSASAAHRWLNCPGSVRLAEGKPRTTPYAAAEGTFAHTLAGDAYAMAGHYAESYNRKTVVDGHTVQCNPEMVAAVNSYYDVMVGLHLQQSWLEMPLREALSWWDEDLGGTADFVSYSKNQKLLRVMDFKYGAGVFVPVENNVQLKTYALGAMLNIDGPVETIETYIFQPRYETEEPLRRFDYTAEQLIEFAGDLAEGTRRTRAPDAPLAAGSWCKFCPNAGTCPELEKKHTAMVTQSFEIVSYTPPQLAEFLRNVPLVEERMRAIKDEAYRRACEGEEIPGFKIVDKRAVRVWTDEKAAAEWAEHRGIDPWDRKMKSPAQLEKGLKAAEKKELEPYYDKVSHGTALVPDSDKRNAVTPVATAEEFPLLETKTIFD